MDTILIALSTWLHALATVVMVGHYLFLSLAYLPVLEKQVQGAALRSLLESVSNRLRPLFGGSLLAFIVTGTYLMLVNDNYLGLGNFFGNAWSIWIIAKHVVVLAFIILAVAAERILLGQIGGANPGALAQFRRAMGINLLLGMLILLMTTIAQVA
jgi:uncharacterized membrane protein